MSMQRFNAISRFSYEKQLRSAERERLFSRVYFFNYLRAFKIHLFYGCIRTFLYMHINTRMDDGVIGYIIQDGMERKNLKHFRAKLKKKSSRKKNCKRNYYLFWVFFICFNIFI